MAVINLQITDNKINNLEEIISLIKNEQININTIEYLKSLKNNLEAGNIINKDELLDTINTKLLEYEIEQERSKDNLATLKMLQETNEEFKSINIIVSSPENNDSNRHIDYITFTNEDGKVEVLCCSGENTINDFIQNHKDTIETYSAKELFYHFKEYIHESLEFVNEEKYKKDMEKQGQAKENEDHLEAVEYQMIEEYKNKYSIQSNIEIAVDQFGERLYRLGDGLFTFKTIDSKRVMETLKTPTLTNNLSNDDLLQELESSPDFTPNNSTIAIGVSNPQLEEDKERVYTFESLPLIDEENYDFDDLQDITQEKIDNIGNPYYTTSPEKEYRLNVYTKYLLNQMSLEIEYKDINCPSADILEGIIEYQLDSFPSLAERYDTNPQELSELDRTFVEKYRENKQELKKLREVEKQKKLVLEQESQSNQSSGVSTIVMLLEIVILAAFVITLLRLDI